VKWQDWVMAKRKGEKVPNEVKNEVCESGENLTMQEV
jgi:hypothetical protein